MPPRKRKKKAAAAKKEEGEEPVEAEAEAEAEEPAAKKQETEAGEEPALVHVVSSSEPAPAAPAPPLDAEVASLLASAREAVAAPQPSVAAAAPPQPSVVQAPPQPSYHAQLAQARAAPKSSYYPQQVISGGRAITGIVQGSPEPLPGDDTTPTKLFVGGLSMVTCKEDLQEYFGRFSAVHDAVIQKHRMTKQSRAVWKSISGALRHRRDVGSIAASARWRGVSRPSTRRCPRGCVGSMAWRFTKVHAIFLRIT